MGKVSHLTPLPFADDLRAYLWAQIEPLGADASGRWLEAKTQGARKKDYWAKILGGVQAMTTNDVEIVAAIFDQSPYDFVRSVRDWNSPSATVHFPDFTREQIQDDLEAAASKRRREAEGDNDDSGFDNA